MKPSCSRARIVSLLACAVTLLFAQQATPQQSSTQSFPAAAPSDATITQVLVKGDSVISRSITDLNEEVGLIVQFTHPPLAGMMRKGRRAVTAELAIATSQIDNDHARFAADVLAIEDRERSKPNSPLKVTASQIRHRYKKVLNGVALKTRRWMLSGLQQLPYVKRIELDARVTKYDEYSNHVIGADSVWAQTGAQGDGVLIGILDTGIDYTHPDLGGGFGPAFKVVGGIDLVNYDNDPMDDEDHGTHVAGIAAADGAGLKGVAPHAKLLAVKVLNENGSGYQSDAIEGMEYALDPDGDPGTDDGVDVLNISFGTSAGPSSDALSEAADATVLAGTVCVAAAGNSGPYYEIIGSPGIGERVLTVGATDNTDIVPSFSSRGPVSQTGRIKPDLLAPGVLIRSTVRGGWATYSGTSMSAPHVTGAVALLKQLHPTWMPEMIKAVLMQSARDLGADVWTQGSGRVDVLKATRARVAVTPSLLYFGSTPMTQASYVHAETLVVRNLTDVAHTYSAISTGFPPGASVSLSPALTSVPGNDSAIVVATLTVNVASVPDADAQTHSYAGHIVISSGTDSAAVLASFAHYPYLQIVLSGAYIGRIYVHNRLNFGGTRNFFAWPVNTTIFLPRDTYDVIAPFENLPLEPLRCVVRENISVPSPGILEIDVQEATTSVTIAPTKIDGSPVDLSMSINSAFILHKETGYGWGFTVMGASWFLYERFNPMSGAYVYDWLLQTDRARPDVYTFCATLDDFSSSRTVTFPPESFKHLSVRYTPLPGMPDELGVVHGFGLNPFPPDRLLWTGNVYSRESFLSSPFQQNWYLVPKPREDFPAKSNWINFTQVYEGGAPGNWNPHTSRLYYLLPTYQAISPDTVRSFPSWFTENSDLKFSGASVGLGLGPTHWTGRFVNSSNLIDFKTNTPYGYRQENHPDGVLEPFVPLFASQFHDFSPKDPYYKVLQGYVVIDSGSVIDHLHDLVTDGYRDSRVQIFIPQSNLYSLLMRDTGYTVQGRRGSSLVKATFDLRNADRNPPVLVSFNILDGDEFTDFIPEDRPAKMRFVLDDDVGVKQVQLMYRSEGDTIWYEVSLFECAGGYEAILPAEAACGFISLRVVASDQSGNVLDMQMEPAFLFGTPVPIQLSSFTATVLDVPHSVKLSWTTLSETNNWGFDVQKSSEATGIYRTIPHSFIPGHGTTLIPQHYEFVDTIADPGVSYYRLRQTDLDGSVHFSEPCGVNVPTAVSESAPPPEYFLAQNYPNPFNSSTTIRYGLPMRSQVTLTIFTALGQEVATAVREEQEAGYHEWRFNASRFASGVYFYRLTAGAYTQTRKLVLVR
ncbi:MAG: S8 family serine peptidase [Bacteroidota bacterium]